MATSSDLESHMEASDENEPENYLFLQDGDISAERYDTWEEAEQFYKTYARQMGFGIKSNDIRRSKASGSITMKEFACTKEGKRRIKEAGPPKRKREPSEETRCGCLAKFRVNYCPKIKKFKVTTFVKEHNHDLTPSNQVHYLRSFKKMTEGDKSTIISLRDSGMKPQHILEYMVKMAGGRDKLGFGREEIYNVVYAHSMEGVIQGDSMRALGFLDYKKEFDDGCYHTYTTTPDRRLGNLFWRDTMCRYDYGLFGDVVAFDATYKSNRYNRPLIMIIGVNNHFRTCFFGCAILEDEKKETYIWLLQNFLKSMDGDKLPLGVITDGCYAMAGAIQEVLPDAKHRLCLWHLGRNIKSHVKNVKKVDELYSDFKELAKMNILEEFEPEWAKLLKKNGLDNDYMKEYIYETKHLWSDAYLKGTFFANMRSTQRCESLNAHWYRFNGTGLKLHTLVTAFDKEFERLRETSLHDDFDTNNAMRRVKGFLPFDTHAASFYTKNMYYKFKCELRFGILLYQDSRACMPGGTEEVFVLSEYNITDDKTVKNTVIYKLVDDTYGCSCQLFQFAGYPCCHQLEVLKMKNVQQLPESLMNMRWSRKAKEGICTNEETVPPQIRKMVRHRSLSSLCNQLCHLASQDSPTFNEFHDELRKWIEKLKASEAARDNSDVNNEEVRDPMRIPRKARDAGNKGSTKKGVSKKSKATNGGSATVAEDEVMEDSATGDTESMVGSRTETAPPKPPKAPPRCGNCRLLGHKKTHCKKRIGEKDVDAPIHDYSRLTPGHVNTTRQNKRTVINGATGHDSAQSSDNEINSTQFTSEHSVSWASGRIHE